MKVSNDFIDEWAESLAKNLKKKLKDDLVIEIQLDRWVLDKSLYDSMRALELEFEVVRCLVRKALRAFHS